MTKQTAVVVALWLLGGAGMLAAVVAAVLLWRDVRDDDAPEQDPMIPETKEES